jgi:ankyrin repeat protein
MKKLFFLLISFMSLVATDKSDCLNQNRALIKASILGNLNGIKQALDQGAYINVAGKWGDTPLMLAAEYGHENIVIFLLEQGANPHYKDKEGNQAKDLTKKKSIKNILKKAEKKSVLNTQEIKDRQLAKAAITGNTDRVKELIDKGAQIHSKGAWGDTPLHFAAEAGHFNTVKELIKQGANPHITDHDGKKPIDLTHNANIKEYLQARMSRP